MTNRFHYNPETGRVSRCTAVHQCPFGSDEQHGSTMGEARLNYESTMAPELLADSASREPKREIELTSPSSLRFEALPEGMDEIVELTGTNIRSYDPHGPASSHRDIYIGGKHRLLDRARTVTLPNGKKVWALQVETDGVRSTLHLPMREHIPAALKYSPEARASNAEAEERRRVWRENYQRQKAEEAARRAEAEAQQARIDATPYEELSPEDRAAADRLKAEAEAKAEEERAAAEEARWDENPPKLTYYGANGYNRGHLQGGENEILAKIRGIPDYNLMDYNNRVEWVQQSDFPREEKERLIREERMGYIQSLNGLLDRRMERAQTTRAKREGFRATLRSFFQSDEHDTEARNSAIESVQRDRQAALKFAEALFAAPPYTKINFTSSTRRF